MVRNSLILLGLLSIGFLPLRAFSQYNNQQQNYDPPFVPSHHQQQGQYHGSAPSERPVEYHGSPPSEYFGSPPSTDPNVKSDQKSNTYLVDPVYAGAKRPPPKINIKIPKKVIKKTKIVEKKDKKGALVGTAVGLSVGLGVGLGAGLPLAICLRKPNLCRKRNRSSSSSTETEEEECGQGCIRNDIIRQIIGGTDSIPNCWPWQVSIRSAANPNGHFCGGSIIDANHIMSAAHCFFILRSNTRTPGDLVILAGIHNRNDAGQQITVTNANININPDYVNTQFTNGNDIAILRTDAPIEFNDNVRPVCLPDTGPDVNARCFVTGWGDITPGGRVLATILQQLEMDIQTNADCAAASPVFTAPETFCAAADITVQNTCQGDSGGPFVCQNDDGTWTQVGIVSYGPTGCLNRPAVFTNVFNELGFINLFTDGITNN